MIGSFWNLCRACPSMPIDKQLHSEYRSTYRWHEFSGHSRPEVVRRAPVPNPAQFIGFTNEPPLPRRKKCPELAYKSHEFIFGKGSSDTQCTNAVRTGRCEDRGTPARRSKSEGPSVKRNGCIYPLSAETEETSSKQAAAIYELEPLVDAGDALTIQDKQVAIVKQKSNDLDHEKAYHLATKKENFGFDEGGIGVPENKNVDIRTSNGSDPAHSHPHLDLWFKEVIELRKKAGEYKCRGWGSEIDPEIYKKQRDLWERVSRRSSLSALSLASTVHRNFTKERKDEENKKKFLPAHGHIISQREGQTIFYDIQVKPTVISTHLGHPRHHLERTTGFDVGKSALIPSPTKERLMPTVRREPDPQRLQGSPKKYPASRQGSPQKRSPQKGSPKKHLKNSRANECDNGKQETLVKSPPEPTRVKSPEQIIMRSPEPVNWTVPLDTGKTFTVTQNVKEGEILSRPQSETKATISIEKPPPPPQSAPPELTKIQNMP